MRTLTLLLIAASTRCLSADAPAAVPAAPPLEWGIERAFLERALAAPPFDLWNDPAAADAVARVARQMRALSDSPSFLPIAELISESRRLQVRVVPAPATSLEQRTDQQLAVMLDAGKALVAMRRFIAKQPSEGQAPATIGSFVGTTHARIFYGFDDASGRMALGGFDSVSAAVASGWGASDTSGWTSPVWLRSDLRQDVPHFAGYADAAGFGASLDKLLPGWRASEPRVGIQSDAGKDGIVTVATCTGVSGLQLRDVDARLLASARQGNQVSLAFALTPVAACDLVMALMARGEMAPEIEREAVATFGVAPRDVAKALAGDVLIQGGWTAGPVPQVAVTATLAKAEAADAAIDAMSGTLGGSSLKIAGADAAWSFSTPVGAVTVARAGTLLVVTNDDARLDAALNAKDDGKVFDRAGVAMARIDAVAIARQWLPMAYSLAANAYVPIGDDPLGCVYGAMGTVESRDATKPLKPLSEALAAEFKHPYFKRPYEHLFPGLTDDQMGKALDASVSVYRPKDGARLSTIAVLREAERFIVVELGKGRKPTKTYDAKSLAQRLDGLEHILGPAPEALAIIAIPERVAFDRTWLPPLNTVIAHLRPYRIDVAHASADGGNLTMTEKGLPLLAPYMYAAANVLWAQSCELDEWRDDAIDSRHASEVTARHQPLIDIVHKLALTINGDPSAPVERASDLLVGAKVTLEDCAPLFAGKVPTDAVELDQVGTFYAKPAGPNGVRWLIPLEPSWVVYVDQWGRMMVTQRDLRIPADAEQAKPAKATKAADF